jgi:hypothetical protein
MMMHHLARGLEARHGVDHPFAVSMRRSADFLATQGRLYEQDCRKSRVANDV